MSEPGAASWWVSLLTRLPRYKLLLRSRWWILALAVALGLLGAALRVMWQPLVYVSTGRIVVSGKISLPENGGYSEETSTFFNTQPEVMKSPEVRRRAEERLQSLEPGIQPAPVLLEVSRLPNTSIFVLTATGCQPDYTRKFLGACMDEYIDTRREMRSEKSEMTLSKLTDQLERFDKEQRESEEELLNFQKENNVTSLQGASNSAGSYLVKLNQQLADLKTEYQLLELLNLDQTLDRKQQARGDTDTSAGPAGSDSVLGTAGPEADYLKAKQEIEVLKARRADLARVLRPKHPDMIQLNEDIARQETLINTFRSQTLDQLKTRRESIRLEMKNLEDNIQQWEAKALVLNQKMAEYNRIKSKGDRAKTSFDAISTSFRSVDANKNLDQDIVSIMERAGPAIPIKPGLAKALVLGLLGGLAAGVGILVLFDKIDDRMNSYSEFQSHFGEGVLARIPDEPRAADPLTLDPGDSRIAFVESLRALRSSIFYLPVEGRQPRTFLIASAVPNEGKSTIASNLAITMSFAGAKVLLIDADLRRGRLHEKFGMDNAVGLGDVLKEKTAARQAVRPTPLANLFLMSRGANLEHPGESFLGKKTDRLLQELYPGFEYIVFDSPPVLVADDTTSLAPKIDATIFVVRFSFSSARRSREAIELLNKRQVNLMGLVCNGVDQWMQDYYYNKYPEYYAVKHDV